MSPAQSDEPRQARATVVAMPSRHPAPAEPDRQGAPPGTDHADGEEPGYGHGV